MQRLLDRICIVGHSGMVRYTVSSGIRLLDVGMTVEIIGNRFM